MKKPYNALFDKLPDNISKNEKAGELMGMREELMKGAIPIDLPCELGYHCPVCKYKNEINGEFDERLHWSEYNSFLWCAVCNKDYPSCLCLPGIDAAINVFLDSVEDACARAVLAKSEATK